MLYFYLVGTTLQYNQVRKFALSPDASEALVIQEVSSPQLLVFVFTNFVT